MSAFSDFFKRGKNYENNNDDVEFYEDTHDVNGAYVGKMSAATTNMPKYITNQTGANVSREPQFQQPQFQQPQGMPLPNKNQFISPRNYQNVVVYEPRSPEDVQTLIDYLKRREPAIINLDKLEEDLSQRILDFVSGAIYALNGSVHRIAGNIFLLSPEGVEITVPYEL